MKEIIAALATTPLPTILTIAGIIFLLLAVTPFTIKGIKVGTPSAKRQVQSGVIGVILLVGGIALYLKIPTSPPETTPTTPAVAPPTIDVITPVSTEMTAPAPLVIPDTIVPTLVGGDTIAITEVLSVPCQEPAGPSVNEYIELYNFGDSAVDVNGWWIGTNPVSDNQLPDELVSWDKRNVGVEMGRNLITNSTIISPSSFAVVLSPNYYLGRYGRRMPYLFPKGTILLTMADGDFIGSETKSLLGVTEPLSVLVLYKGTVSIIDDVISTYGTPNLASIPNNIRDDGLDKFPYSLDGCYSMERIVASGPDAKSNWRRTNAGVPGGGNY